MKFSRQLVVSSLAVIVLSACSSSPAERRQAGDDFSYLETKAFEAWTLPEGAESLFYPNYDIPAGEFKGPVGSAVDIRPPQQLLELVPGARTELDNGSVIMWLVKQEEMDKVWSTAREMLQARNIALRENSNNRIETGWVSWNREDEDSEVSARFVMERFEANRRFGFRVSMLEWRQGEQVQSVSGLNRERYNIQMANLVTMLYDKKQQDEAERRAQQLVQQIPVSVGKDRNGLPVIIARAQYNIFWKRAADILPKLGFKLKDRNQSQGVIETEYNEADEEFWQRLDMAPLSLTGTEYTFQLGDLGNRTSIAITNYEDKAVDEQALAEVSEALAAVMKLD
ncbi:outer membrane protein assembly factor BamC [Vibrio albus]|jgi:outer membrane protein assembly factor BamC|uniref:Outer membrane protein assembly factor BamC n=1 Tax=Vibrio albus TaxID=2200953 RepID=A0A2U3BCH7_9VIBR|nr:outer membrane protein assembly factor BamC [Vibrio albus]PWI34434.1 outer membrane protein assembly factor BamC [Vibrio albus]